MGITVEVIEKGFSRKNLPTCELSILIGMDSFSYALIDERGRVQVLKEHLLAVPSDEDAWASMRAEESLLDHDYDRVNIGLALPPYTFVPKPLFEPAEAREYLSHLTVLDSEDEVTARSIANMNTFNLFVVPAWLKRRISELPKSSNGLKHLSGLLLQKAKAKSEASDQPFLWAHFMTNRIWLLALENGALKYSNSFHYLTENDALYYLLMLFDHIGLAPDRTPIQLSGKIGPELSLYKNLTRFVAQPVFFTDPDEVEIGTQLLKYPPHWFYDLLSMSS